MTSLTSSDCMIYFFNRHIIHHIILKYVQKVYCRIIFFMLEYNHSKGNGVVWRWCLFLFVQKDLLHKKVRKYYGKRKISIDSRH